MIYNINMNEIKRVIILKILLTKLLWYIKNSWYGF